MAVLGAVLALFGSRVRSPVYGVLVNRDAVELEQAGDNLDVLDLRDVAQHGRLVAQQGSNHGLGDKILGPTDGDAAS